MYVLYLKLICSNTYVKKKALKSLIFISIRVIKQCPSPGLIIWQPPIKEENQFWPLPRMYQHLLECYFNSYMHVYITT